MAIAAGADERPSVKIDLLDHKVLRRELEAETLQVLVSVRCRYIRKSKIQLLRWACCCTAFRGGRWDQLSVCRLFKSMALPSAMWKITFSFSSQR